MEVRGYHYALAGLSQGKRVLGIRLTLILLMWRKR
jgi:hypothetical protein